MPCFIPKMKVNIINIWLVSAERGTNSGSSNLGFIAGQSFGAAVVGYPSGDHTLWGGVWESGDVTVDRMALSRRIQTEQGLRMEGWRGSQDLITSAGRRQIAGQCFEGLRKAKCGCRYVPEGTKVAVLLKSFLFSNRRSQKCHLPPPTPFWRMKLGQRQMRL